MKNFEKTYGSNGAMTMGNELVEIEGIKIQRDQVDLIKRTIFIGATDDELRLFFYECARRGTHPMDRLIYPVVRKDKDGNRRVAFQTGIDYLRAAAEETARYCGQRQTLYGPMVKQSISEGEPIDVPEWAEAIVIRKDPETGEITDQPFRAYWKEYYPGEKMGHMWRRMPHLMLGKCAEAGALRKGFPRKLGGLYINEEMQQAEAVPFAPIQEPQKKGNGKPPETSTTSLTVSVDQVEVKTGTSKGKAWTLYTIHAAGEKYNTFSETFGGLAQRSADEKVNAVISWSQTEKGKKLESITLEEGPEPGSEG